MAAAAGDGDAGGGVIGDLSKWTADERIAYSAGVAEGARQKQAEIVEDCCGLAVVRCLGDHTPWTPAYTSRQDILTAAIPIANAPPSLAGKVAEEMASNAWQVSDLSTNYENRPQVCRDHPAHSDHKKECPAGCTRLATYAEGLTWHEIVIDPEDIAERTSELVDEILSAKVEPLEG